MEKSGKIYCTIHFSGACFMLLRGSGALLCMGGSAQDNQVVCAVTPHCICEAVLLCA